MKTNYRFDRYPLVSIVICSYNNYNDIEECIGSIKKLEYKNYHVIIVNNGSNDPNYDELPKKYSGVIYLKIDVNKGFSGGNNVGIKYALKHGAEYVLLLSDDVVVRKKFLSELVKFGLKHHDAGLIGGKQYFYSEKKLLYAAGGDLNTFTGVVKGIGLNKKDSGQYELKKEVDYIPLAAAMFRKEVFESIGLLPECYYLGGEEGDIAYRAKKSGYKIFFNPDSVCYHKVGYSGKTSYEYLYNRFRNRLMFIDRNFYGILRLSRLVYFVFRNIVSFQLYGFILRDFSKIMVSRAAKMALKDNKKYTKIEALHLERAKEHFTKLE